MVPQLGKATWVSLAEFQTPGNDVTLTLPSTAAVSILTDGRMVSVKDISVTSTSWHQDLDPSNFPLTFSPL